MITLVLAILLITTVAALAVAILTRIELCQLRNDAHHQIVGLKTDLKNVLNGSINSSGELSQWYCGKVTVFDALNALAKSQSGGFYVVPEIPAVLTAGPRTKDLDG